MLRLAAALPSARWQSTAEANVVDEVFGQEGRRADGIWGPVSGERDLAAAAV